MLTVVASWLRIVPSYIGWVGFTVAMTSTVASWVQDPLAQAAVGAVGVFLVLLLLIGKTSGSKRATLPGNYEAELLRLCYGDTAVASRLIKRELKRHPRFSRQAAAMAAVARLKRDR